MKKKIITIALCFGTVFMFAGLVTYKTNAADESNVNVKNSIAMSGKRCNATVGCDCSGFSAITNGEEWQKSYCKRCSHHKKYHK